MAVPEEEALRLQDNLETVVQKAADSHGVAAQAELHGYDLMNGKKDWTALSGKFRARFGIFLDALRAIAATTGIRAFCHGLDRAALKVRYYTPYPEVYSGKRTKSL